MTAKVTYKPSFQGDLMIRRIDALPRNIAPVEANRGKHILAHSETGHHHVVEANRAEYFVDKMNAFIHFLKVSEEAAVTHERSYHTHAALTLPPGLYEVRQQREYTPEGFRRVED